MQHRRRLNTWRMIKRQHEQQATDEVAILLDSEHEQTNSIATARAVQESQKN